MDTRGQSGDARTSRKRQAFQALAEHSAGDVLLALCVSAAGLALYLRTLAPTVVTVFDDSPEFQLVCYLLGVAHPTGYPLYTLLGKLFTLLPWGDVAYRVNLLSAVCGALTLAGLALLVRELTGRRLAGAMAALALGVSPVFWSQATIAEVYALHALFVTLCLWLLARWERGIHSAPAGLPNPALLLALTFGLGLTHHRMIGLIAPAILLVAYLVWRRWPAAESLAAPTWPRRLPLLLALILPLALYLYIPLIGARVGSLDGTYRNTLAGFLQQVLALSYGAFISGNPFGQSRDLAFYLALWRDQFGVVGMLLGLAGLLYPARRRRMQLALLLSLVLNLAFALLYRVADIEVFLLPAFLLWAVGIGLALGAVQSTLDASVHSFIRAPHSWMAGRMQYAPTVLGALLVLAFAAQPLAVAVRAWPAADRSQDWAVHDAGVDTLAQPLPQGATVIGLLGEMTILHYLQRTEGLRPDIQTIAANPESERWAALERAIPAAGAAYLTRQLPGAEGRYHLDAVGPLIRVMPKPAAVAAPACAGTEIVPGLCLASFTTQPSTQHGTSQVRLTLNWIALRAGLPDLRLSARLQAPDGSSVAQHDARPVHETYPTTVWRAGESVIDVHDLVLWPPATLAGEHNVILVVYNPEDGRELGRATLGRLSGEPALP